MFFAFASFFLPQVKFGSLFLAFEDKYRLWFVGPITFRRTLLQLLATVLKKVEYAPAMVGCSIAIHTLYGYSVARHQPYTDTDEDADKSKLDDLDKLAIFHSVVQVALLILGLISQATPGDEGAGTAIAVSVFLLGAAAMAASAVVASREKAGRTQGALSLTTLRSSATAYQASYCETVVPLTAAKAIENPPLTAAEAATISKEEGTDKAVTSFSVGSRRFELKLGELDDEMIEDGTMVVRTAKIMNHLS